MSHVEIDLVEIREKIYRPETVNHLPWYDLQCYLHSANGLAAAIITIYFPMFGSAITHSEQCCCNSVVNELCGFNICTPGNPVVAFTRVS